MASLDELVAAVKATNALLAAGVTGAALDAAAAAERLAVDGYLTERSTPS